MSFYVTLPSNASMDVYPENTMTRYTTKLKTPLQLEGKFQVGLAEIMYPVNWKFRKDETILCSSVVAGKKKDTKCVVQFFANETIFDIIENINAFFKKEGCPVDFNYNVSTKTVAMTYGINTTVSLTKELADVFGFVARNFQGPKTNAITFQGDKKVNKSLNNISTAYIYSDIVEFQAVGDATAQLLRVIAIQDNVYVDSIYDSPHYVDVIRNNIDTIEIDIRSDTTQRSIESGQWIEYYPLSALGSGPIEYLVKGSRIHRSIWNLITLLK